MSSARPRPRRYTYFAALYKLTYWGTFFGYFLALIDFIGLGAIIQAAIHPAKPHP